MEADQELVNIGYQYDPQPREVFDLLIYAGPSLARGTSIWTHGRHYADHELLRALANSFLPQCPHVFPT
jgi:hypothetical protein